MRRILIVALLGFTLGGCDSGASQSTFRELALGPPSGFTRTDAQGTVVSVDAGDWQVSPLYSPASVVWVTVQPSFPNPVAPDGVITLILNVRSGAVVGGLTAVGYVERPGQLPDSFILDEVVDARGFVTFSIVPAQHPGFSQGAGLRRVVVFDGRGEPVTFGDVMIE